jgi:type II secretory pathway component PulK
MRRRGDRGIALLWAILVLFVVSVACAAFAESLTRQTRILRLASEKAALSDLRRSGRILARARLRDPSWTGFDQLDLAGGHAFLSRTDPTHVTVRSQASISGRSIEDVVAGGDL